MTEEREYFTDRFGNTHGDTVLTTPVGRADWVQLNVPSGKFNKYGLTITFDKKALNEKDKKLLAAMVDVCKPIIAFKAKGKALKIVKQPLLDGDAHKDPDDEDSPILYPGCWFIQANNPAKPTTKKLQMVDGELIDTPIDANLIRSGNFVRALVKPMLTSTNGIAWKVLYVRLVKDDGFTYKHNPDMDKIMAMTNDDIFGDEAESQVALVNPNVQEDDDDIPFKESKKSKATSKKGLDASVDLL